jgi:hypothetical protein
MSDTHDDFSRQFALQQANEYIRTGAEPSAEEVVARAQAYFDFLSGDQDVKSPPSDKGNPERADYHQGWNQALLSVLSLKNANSLQAHDTVTVYQAENAIRSLLKGDVG